MLVESLISRQPTRRNHSVKGCVCAKRSGQHARCTCSCAVFNHLHNRVAVEISRLGDHPGWHNQRRSIVTNEEFVGRPTFRS